MRLSSCHCERSEESTRSNFWHLLPGEKIHRLVEILPLWPRSQGGGSRADSAQDDRSKVVRCVRNRTRSTVLCARATLARGLRGRSRGLLGRRQLSPNEGMLFEAEPLPLMWMHTFFMAFPIDVVFLGRGDIVIKIQSSLKPWRLSPIVFGARKAIELAEGAAAKAETTVGDFISLTELQDSEDPTQYTT
jgi:uncharacterized membrane protein (UPF0127 family)